MSRRLKALAVIAAVTLVGCGADQASVDSVRGCVETASGSVRGTIPVVMDDHAFAPACMVGASPQVTLVVRNRGRVPHTLTVAEQGVDRTLDAGEVAFIQVRVPEGSGVTFVCRFHLDEGMVGVVRR